MVIVRWVTPGADPQKPVNVRDQRFDTKREALDAISRQNISAISHLPNPERLYVVVLKKER